MIAPSSASYMNRTFLDILHRSRLPKCRVRWWLHLPYVLALVALSNYEVVL